MIYLAIGILFFVCLLLFVAGVNYSVRERIHAPIMNMFGQGTNFQDRKTDFIVIALAVSGVAFCEIIYQVFGPARAQMLAFALGPGLWIWFVLTAEKNGWVK